MKTVERLMDAFHDYMVIELGLSRNTIEGYTRDVLQYLDYLDTELGIHDVKAITKDAIHTFIAHLYDKKLNASTVSRKISAIKLFHKFLYLTIMLTRICLALSLNQNRRRNCQPFFRLKRWTG